MCRWCQEAESVEMSLTDPCRPIYGTLITAGRGAWPSCLACQRRELVDDAGSGTGLLAVSLDLLLPIFLAMHIHL